MTKLNIGIVFGSRSPEHDISIMTALGVIAKSLTANANYNLVPIYITKTGQWFSDPKLLELSLFTDKNQTLELTLSKLKPILLSLNNGFSIIKPAIRNTTIKLDCVFPALHGGHGEDGEVMAILNMANVAYVGCDVTASQIAMDKVLLKQLAELAGVAITKYVWFYDYQYRAEPQLYLKQINKLKFPLFVKPAHLGSSIAISKVNSPSELAPAIDVALYYDDKVLIEEAVNNLIELTLPIIGNQANLETGLLERPLFKEASFFDFESKYISSASKSGTKKTSGNYSQLPAKIATNLADQASQIATKTYKLIGCSGIARVDLLLDAKKNQLYLNELNPLPGDLYIHNWQAKGFSAADLCDKLIKYGLERHHQKQKIVSAFKTNYLGQFKSSVK